MRQYVSFTPPKDEPQENIPGGDDDIPWFLTPGRLARLSGLSETMIYDLLAMEIFRARKLGNSTLVDARHAYAQLQALPHARYPNRHAISAASRSLAEIIRDASQAAKT